jgi:outer membrane protein with beta-barrel domain
MARNRSLQGSICNARVTSAGLTLTLIIVVLMAIVPLYATNQHYRVCFTQVVGLPVLNPPQIDPCTGQPIVPNQAPVIDGCVKGDPGWTGAFRYVFGNGTGSLPNAAVQGIRDNTFLYLSIEVNNENKQFDDRDLVILAFSPTDGMSPTDDRRIHIYPNNTGVQKGVGSSPRLVEYWTDSSHWNNPPCVSPGMPPGCDPLAAPKTLPGTVSIAVSNSGPINNLYSWVVEMKIPLTDFDIPATGRFGFYVDVMRVMNLGFVNQYYWPSFIGNGVQIAPEQHTPATSNWGEATQDPTLATTCKGVSINWNDITSNHSSDQIDATPGNSNTFSALLHNNSVDMNGNPISANQIIGTFSIANFGLPSNWTPVPVGTPAGSAGPINILPNLTGTLNTSPAWNITDPNLINNYKAHPDQCILVDLDSTAPDCVANPNNCVSILNKSVKRNMWVLTASEVSKSAEISAKGYGPPPAGRTEQEFELRVLSRQEVLKQGEPALSKLSGQQTQAGAEGSRNRVVSRLTWAVEGCRFTGQYVTIKGEKYEICDDVGAFGAIVEHFGKAGVERWIVSLEGPELTRDERVKDAYRLRVPLDAIATVTTNFHPQEPSIPPGVPKFAIFLGAGTGIPQGTFGNAFNTGFSLNAGLEYIATSHFSVEGIFGYHHFPAKTVGGVTGTALNLYQFSGNGKVYLNSSGPFRPFVNAGIGGYDFTPGGGTHFGGNVGAGVLREFGPHWGLQASYNFHTVNTPGAATKFSTIQGGIRYVF